MLHTALTPCNSILFLRSFFIIRPAFLRSTSVKTLCKPCNSRSSSALPHGLSLHRTDTPLKNSRFQLVHAHAVSLAPQNLAGIRQRQGRCFHILDPHTAHRLSFFSLVPRTGIGPAVQGKCPSPARRPRRGSYKPRREQATGAGCRLCPFHIALAPALYPCQVPTNFPPLSAAGWPRRSSCGHSGGIIAPVFPGCQPCGYREWEVFCGCTALNRAANAVAKRPAHIPAVFPPGSYSTSGSFLLHPIIRLFRQIHTAYNNVCLIRSQRKRNYVHDLPFRFVSVQAGFFHHLFQHSACRHSNSVAARFRPDVPASCFKVIRSCRVPYHSHEFNAFHLSTVLSLLCRSARHPGPLFDFFIRRIQRQCHRVQQALFSPFLCRCTVQWFHRHGAS